jgi:hypothetical protein
MVLVLQPAGIHKADHADKFVPRHPHWKDLRVFADLCQRNGAQAEPGRPRKMQEAKRFENQIEPWRKFGTLAQRRKVPAAFRRQVFKPLFNVPPFFIPRQLFFTASIPSAVVSARKFSTFCDSSKTNARISGNSFRTMAAASRE